jgi:hypothetical protein
MRIGDFGFGSCDKTVHPSLAFRLRSLAGDLENLNGCAKDIEPGAAINRWTLGSRAVPCLTGPALWHSISQQGNRRYE